MSQAEIERFARDLKSDPKLLEEVKAAAGSLASVVGIARSKGYDISVEEAKAHIRSQSDRVLSDEDLDAIAGGTSLSLDVAATSITTGTSVSTSAHTLFLLALVATST